MCSSSSSSSKDQAALDRHLLPHPADTVMLTPTIDMAVAPKCVGPRLRTAMLRLLRPPRRRLEHHHG